MTGHVVGKRRRKEEHRPGSLAAAASKLAAKQINIDAIYVVGMAGGKKQLAVGSADAAAARNALK